MKPNRRLTAKQRALLVHLADAAVHGARWDGCSSTWKDVPFEWSGRADDPGRFRPDCALALRVDRLLDLLWSQAAGVHHDSPDAHAAAGLVCFATWARGLLVGESIGQFLAQAAA